MKARLARRVLTYLAMNRLSIKQRNKTMVDIFSKISQISSNNRVLIFILGIIGFISYLSSLGNAMFWDDYDGILNNHYIKSWQYLPNYFSENLIAGSGFLSNYWRPALLFIYSLEWKMWGSWAFGYHFVNTVFHITCAVLLFLLLLNLFGKKTLAFFTSLIFLVHPLQTEAVTYVSGLGDSLSVFFILLGLLSYLKSREIGKKSYFSLSLICFSLALMSKETAITMPGLIFLIEMAKSEKPFSNQSLRKSLKAIFWFVALAAFYVLLRATCLNFQNTFNLYNEENEFTQSFFVRIYTFFRILVIYFSLLFAPFGLHMERSVDLAKSFFSWDVLLGFMIVLLTVFSALTSARKNPQLTFGICWFYLLLLPVSNIFIPINGLLYEHWLYLPMAGFFFSLFLLGQKISAKYKWERIFWVFVSIFAIFLVILTIRQNTLWRNPIVFYEYTLGYSPKSYRLVNNLGMAYADAENNEKAIETYQRAVKINPNNPVAYHNLGNSYKGKNDISSAEQYLLTALEKDPRFYFSYNALIKLYLEENDLVKTQKILEKYYQNSDPGTQTEILLFLAEIAARQQDYQGSLKYIEEGLEKDPSNNAFLNAKESLKTLIEAPTQ